MDRWKSIIAIVGGLGTVGGAIVAVLISLADSRAAAQVAPVKERVTIIEVRTSDIKDLLKELKVDIRDVREQLNQWGQTGRIPIVPSPAAPEKRTP